MKGPVPVPSTVTVAPVFTAVIVDFVPFAWYRIAFGIVVLATAWSGLVTWAE